jgi:hypothetical protein
LGKRIDDENCNIQSQRTSSAGALEEFDEDFAGGAADLVGSVLEGVVAHKVGLVVVSPELGQHGLELVHLQVGVALQAEQVLHLVKIGGVKPAAVGVIRMR